MTSFHTAFSNHFVSFSFMISTLLTSISCSTLFLLSNSIIPFLNTLHLFVYICHTHITNPIKTFNSAYYTFHYIFLTVTFNKSPTSKGLFSKSCDVIIPLESYQSMLLLGCSFSTYAFV
mgnify:CR=1 FL=1